MADAGNLGKLPPEIRKEIYAHLLVEDKAIPIRRLMTTGKKQRGKTTEPRAARMDKRPLKHAGKAYDRRNRVWVNVPLCTSRGTTSLLRVNKLIGYEAAQVLYGSNQFAFENAGALERFVRQIGDNLPHLRCISIIGEGILFMGLWSSMDRAIEALTVAKGLRTLEFSHLAFCDSGRFWESKIKEVVEHCVPLLAALQAAFQANDLNHNVLHILKITLPPCGLDAGDEAEHQYNHSNNTHNGLASPRRRFALTRSKRLNSWGHPVCCCDCGSAEDKNKQFSKMLKKEIVEQLGLNVDDEQRK